MNKERLQHSYEIGRDEIITKDLAEIKQRLSGFESLIKNKTFLVSGGAGFLGSWFCDTAVMFGGRVTCIDNLISSSFQNIRHLEKNPNFRFVNANITELTPHDKVDYVVHMASIASPPLTQKYPKETLDSGVIGTLKLLEFAKKHKVAKFLFTSTSEVYGNPPNNMVPTPEDYFGNVNSYGPRAIYDESKRAGEAYCFAYSSEWNVPVRIVRIFNTYGPRIDVKHPSQYGRVLIKFVYQALNNVPMTVYGDGSQTRSFCYIVDQIDGLYRLLLTDSLSEVVVNIGSDQEISMLNLAKMVRELTESKSEILLGAPSTYNLQDDPRRRCPNISKAKRLLGYLPQISLKEGLERTIKWNRNLLQI